MKELLDFTGKTAVITGGTRGIGFGIAKVFFIHGADTVIIGRDAIRGQNAVEELKLISRKYDNSCRFYQCDISVPLEVQVTCEKILEKFRKVDILILNAGIEVKESQINDTTIEDWQKVMDVNVSSSFYMLRSLVSSMITNKSGNIILISSTASIYGGGTAIPYPVSKAALQGLMARINYDLLGKGIRANMISPGMVDTPMLRKKYPDNRETNESLYSQVPVGRLGTSEDIGNIALFLASDMSSYVCGENIFADGGRLKYRRSVVKR